MRIAVRGFVLFAYGFMVTAVSASTNQTSETWYPPVEHVEASIHPVTLDEVIVRQEVTNMLTRRVDEVTYREVGSGIFYRDAELRSVRKANPENVTEDAGSI
ncbi:MAG: hypothetical protein KDL31_05040, partial [Kiritimatiellae bacterium]|nr:hypothetical protein [Kiritimatiellia bacterium]